MNDLATLNGKPRVLRVGGKEYPVHPLTLADFGELQAWVDAQQPDPLDVAHRAVESGRYTVAQQQFLLKTAMELASRPRRLIGTAEADELLRSMDGIVQVLVKSIRKGRPEFSDADAKALYAAMTFADVARLMEDTHADMVMSDPTDPKAAAG